MLPLKLQNRIDLLFAHAVRKNPDCACQPFIIADAIFEQIQPDSGSLYLKDVQLRCKILASRLTCESLADSSSINTNGRPKKWHLPLARIYVPQEFASALTEIALEWQQNSLDSMPF